MYYFSGKKFLYNLGKALVKAPLESIKNKSIKLYNDVQNITPKLKTTKIYEDMNYFFIKILFLDDGNFIVNDNSRLLNKMEIINGKTFKIIKKINIKNYKGLEYISDIISLKKNEIIFCDDYLRIGYILFDKTYKIKNIFFKSYNNENFSLKDAYLKILNNKKIVYMGSKSTFKKSEEESIGITKIYILKLYRNNSDFIMETKINAFKTYFYEIKSKNVYLINNKKDFVGFFNNKSLKVVKNVKFNIYDNMKMINDEYFIQGGKEGQIYLYKLDCFELIKIIISNKIYDIINIFVFEKNIIFTYEIQPKEYSGSNYLKKWEFNEQEKDIKCVGHLHLDDIYLYQMKKIKNENDIFLFHYYDGFRLIEFIPK